MRAQSFAAITLLVVSASLSAQNSRTPNTILDRGEGLARSKQALAQNNPAVREAYDALLVTARAALVATPASVMEKQNTPPSGTKHDYMSMAPYWWPDTTKPDGLPFIRRDGIVYPASRTDHDGTRFRMTVERVQALALAYYFTGESRYSEGAAKHLRVFFLDTAMRMNPNLRYAQAVRGQNDGRGIGIIDTDAMPHLVDALRLLDGAPGWTSRDAADMRTWCQAYLTWLLESPNGRDERAALNNHGTFYDAQVAALAIFVGDTTLARTTIGESARARIASQIDADGKQKLELERTRPLHYSIFNLDAFTMLAEMGRHVGVDLWRYTAPSGGSIEKALRVVAPYADSTKVWPGPQVRQEGMGDLLLPLRRASAALHNAEFAQDVQFLPPDLRRRDYSRFSFPDTP